MAKYVIGLFVLIFSQRVCGQTFYITHEGKVSRISIKDNKVTGESLTLCDEVSQPMSIAIYQNTLYSVNYIFAGKGIISGNRVDNCTAFDGKTYGGNALTVDKNGDFYTTWGDTLVKVDINKGIRTNVGVIPFISAGDLAFYNNSLYLTSTQGIVKINLQDVSKSELVIPSDISFWGLTTAAVSSTQNKLYAMAPESYETTVFEVDLDNNRIGKVVAVIPYLVNDAASYGENGSTSVMEITGIKQIPNCENDGKGTIQVICRENLSDYRYTLNGVTNSTGIFTNVPSGAQSVTVTSDTETKTIPFTAAFILEKPELIITKKDPLCTAKGEIAINAKGNADEYKIRYNNVIYNIGNLFQDLTAGTYQFEILNQNGCIVDRKEVKLTQDICRITVTQINVTEECDDPGKAHIEIVTAPHTEVYNYKIGNISNTTGIFNNIPPGVQDVRIVSSNTDEKLLQITVPDYNALKPAVNVNKTDASCDIGGSISFSIQTPNSLQFKVKYNDLLFPISNVFTDLAAGNYRFTIIDTAGCVFERKEVILSRQQCIIQIIGLDVKEECDMPGRGALTVAALPHTDVYTYTISNGLVNNTGVFNNLLPGNYTLKVVNADDEKNLNFIVPDYNASKPNISFTANNLLCDAPGTIQFSIDNIAAGNYLIRSNGVTYDFDHVFSANATGVYQFEIIKPNGCILKTIEVPIGRTKCEIELLTPTVKQQCDVAFKGTVQINSKQHTYIYTYKIDNGSTNTSGLFDNLEPGVYTISVSSIEDSKQISITIPDYDALSPKVSITKIDAECDLKGLVKFNLSSNSNGYTIKMGTSTFPFDHDFKLGEGEHNFTVFKADGCLLDSYRVDVKKLSCDVMVFPSAFTPNGDGINDVFQPNQGSDAISYNLKIYSRTGMLLFNTNALQNGWQGEYNGSLVNSGVYYWVVTYTNNTGKSLNKSGSVTLIR